MKSRKPTAPIARVNMCLPGSDQSSNVWYNGGGAEVKEAHRAIHKGEHLSAEQRSIVKRMHGGSDKLKEAFRANRDGEKLSAEQVTIVEHGSAGAFRAAHLAHRTCTCTTKQRSMVERRREICAEMRAKKKQHNMSASGNSKYSAENITLWNRRFEELRAYKKSKHGDYNVPQGYKENPSLGIWVNTQRQQ